MDDLPIFIEEVDADDNTVEVMARAANDTIGIAAFNAAVEVRPHRRIILRRWAHVMQRWEPVTGITLRDFIAELLDMAKDDTLEVVNSEGATPTIAVRTDGDGVRRVHIA